MSGPNQPPQTPEYLALRRARMRERRRMAREALGFKSAAEFRDYAQRKAFELRAARKAAGQLVITPSIAKLQAERVAPAPEAPAETVEQFLARGGQVETLPGFTPRNDGPLPVRSFAAAGNLW